MQLHRGGLAAGCCRREPVAVCRRIRKKTRRIDVRRAGFRGADDGVRTRDPDLGKVVLYQLSHVRIVKRAVLLVIRPRKEERMEATPGFEPGVKALQASALPLGHVAVLRQNRHGKGRPKLWSMTGLVMTMERTTGFEPATPTLARSCSTS